MATMTLEQIEQGVLKGQRRAIAKAITLVESSRREDNQQAQQLLNRLAPHTGSALRVAISGPPGAGKSTFIESFGLQLAELGKKIGVLAVDPTSSRTGGSILGDKTRMGRLTISPNAFIRPSPAGKTLGGVARRTREAMLILEAAGYDIILVETVGVGQSETLAAGMTDLFLLLALPNAGDELQGIKRGIMELADIVLVNKCDGDFIPAAQETKASIGAALKLLQRPDESWSPCVETISAFEEQGLEQVWQLMQQYHEAMSEGGALQAKRHSQAKAWMWDLIQEGLMQRFMEHPEVITELPQLEQAVADANRSPVAAAEQLLRHFGGRIDH
uniref:LAO/AO transport system kinase, argK family n=1 Tax=Magnetococcus massalia (strain MO-1) TaxID=451514 RepID=A0A1S7LE75_MAGMO|nr:LAO/AO transport system kinase, argK family [Candidatus Magnetococcus massalia]